MSGQIFDTHVHLYQVTRPGGVPWPPPENRTLYKDRLPGDYKSEAAAAGVVGAGIVEASPLHQDTSWILQQIGTDPFFPFYVAQLSIGHPDFARQLAEIAEEPRVVGIRAFLWNPDLTLDDRQQADLRALAARGMTLDLISRGTLNPKDMVDRLAEAVPSLRLILDHLAGARGGAVDPGWANDMARLGRRPNVHMKLSALFDMWNPTGDQTHPWQAHKQASDYAPHFDVVMEAFGPERLLFGSDWPVCNLAGTMAEEIRILEDYLRPHGTATRDRVMHDNARAFYRRV